jgi:hypothetical protein
MKTHIMLFLFIFIAGWPNVAHYAGTLPDEPEVRHDLSAPYQFADSYQQALDTWKTAEDISRWVAESFVYDKSRAMKLSTNRKTRTKAISVYDPPEFFTNKAGVCVDLARFGFETLKTVEPISHPKYLMIEFEPIKINGNTFRLHWLVSFERDGMKYFFCDSRRPGYIAGPYNNTQVFINEYEQYRDRKIVTYRELESYQKQKKSQSRKARATKKSSKVNAAER